MPDSNAALGFHASISGGVDNAPKRVKQLDCPVGQIFTSSNRRWAIRDLQDGEAESFRDETAALPHGIIAHACYLINLAKPEQEAWEKSVSTLRKEVERCEELGIRSLVLHPGSHVGSGEEQGLERIIEGLNNVLAETGAETKILVETMAGQGTSLGYRLEHLLKMRQGVDQSSRVEYCLDTCHMHAGGYDMRSEAKYESTMETVEDVLELEHVTVLHLNDSKKEFDSRVDRHEDIGEGTLGEEAFRSLVNDSRWDGIPKILETPVDEDWESDYGRNLRKLMEYVN